MLERLLRLLIELGFGRKQQEQEQEQEPFRFIPNESEIPLSPHIVELLQSALVQDTLARELAGQDPVHIRQTVLPGRGMGRQLDNNMIQWMIGSVNRNAPDTMFVDTPGLFGRNTLLHELAHTRGASETAASRVASADPDKPAELEEVLALIRSLQQRRR